MNNTDLTFITNLPGQTLKDRFNALIKDTRFFDVLVGYFYVSGFYAIYKSLENTEKIRILIGISTTKQTYDLIEKGRHLSQKEAKELVEEEIIKEFEDSEDKKEVEEGILKFIEWISTGRLEIRAYPERNLHAKLYIMTFKEGDRDVGRVITGSSNFTQKGLVENLEFNVELKNISDYQYAKKKFEELWEDSVEVSEKFVQTIKNKTFINDSITPYELYLKFLYEYFKEELDSTQNLDTSNLPENFKNLEYQRQAVLNAKKIIEEHGGVFISDVVGLGKTYMTAMLVSQLGGNTMVIAPPSLLSRSNPGSWENVLRDFHIPFKAISIGKLEEALEEIEFREYKNIIIDESHRFRNESTKTYEKLAEICRGKRVILVSATPYNNSPKDILAQIKLFQNPRRSTIPGILDLESFFNELKGRIEKAKKSQDPEKFVEESKEVAKEIRDKVLKYIMIRRTRKDIETYFKEDLERNNLKFPQVNDPTPVLYQLNEIEDNAFMKTVELVAKRLKYARYTPLLYLKSQINTLKQSQKNMASFMKVLLVKRLESSFYAFNKTLDRFIKSYEGMLNAINQKGKVYISKRFSDKILEFLESDNDEEIEKLLNEGKAEEYDIHDFKENFIEDLKKDLDILKQIKSLWQDIERDPKLDVLIQELKNNPILKDKKVIIFTESKETAEYLTENLNKIFDNKVLLFHGGSSEEVRDKIIENFDDRSRVKKDDYRILVTTDVLSEGVNLHRSNIIINYDIPWNPTKIIQRVGRVNRLDTKFDEIYVYNFFPTAQVEDQIKLKQIARSKVEAFLNLLGGDAAILTEGESVKSYELFDKLTSKNFITDEDFEESELKYYRIIEKIRDENPDLFDKIKQLPKKARAGKKAENITNALLTFFRKGKLMKFYLSDKNKTQELDFLTAVKFFECDESQQKIIIPIEEFYNLLEKNKKEFIRATYEEEFIHHKPGKDSSKELLKHIKAIFKDRKKLTEEQEKYIDLIIERIEEGALPKKTVQNALRAIKHIEDPLKAISILKNEIPKNLVYKQHLGVMLNQGYKREVILSLYLGA
ncbi:helicase-related protein [Sulfurihydrogenibium yellowstonense]|uniref:Helicase domain protein n=1 Tax=Sulfurihydrogenibium yellowstonense SS-5 TaxID=432331 RepID=C4FJ50_9AQUI|nr:helicase-related protein [Sulfurihydrogenibium yellowstonense]EEP60905.1 helicase domain protein [Sulfurihydrogenibium yellowstonense SS-5]